MDNNEMLLSAVKQIAAERGIDQAIIIEALKKAIAISFREGDDIEEDEDAGSNINVEIDPDAGTINVFADKKVVDMVTSPPTQISLEDAQKIEPKLEIGDHVLVEITESGDFGRVAAQAARQIIVQTLRESEKEALLQQFTDKIGGVESAIVQRVDREGNAFLEIQRATAKMPPAEQIKGEFYRSSSRIKVYLKNIHEDARGKILIVSRSDPDFLRALFEIEVPEIASGTVEIMSIAREAGSRSKVAVKSNAEGVDAIGSCVGQRGARISAVTNELKSNNTEEKIDIIEWDDDLATFIGNAIKPAEAIEVKLIDQEAQQALIIVEDDSLSLAIGRDGQNVRLAAKLTGWALDIQGQNMFEENNRMSKFEMDAVAAGKAKKSVAPKKADTEDAEVVEDEGTDEQAEGLAGLGLTTRVVNSLAKAGITDEADLRAKIDSGEKIPGVGPKSIEEIKAALG